MTINDHAREPSFITMNFHYLIDNGFRTVGTERSSDGKSWSITMEGKCRIQILWNWHDGIDILVSKSITPGNEIPKRYTVDLLVYYLLGKEIIERHFAETNMRNSPDNIAPDARLLETHLDRIIDFVSSDQLEQQALQIEQARKALIELHLQRREQKS
jgi:hypothetical protein